jgi:hypothetical protein
VSGKLGYVHGSVFGLDKALQWDLPEMDCLGMAQILRWFIEGTREWIVQDQNFDYIPLIILYPQIALLQGAAHTRASNAVATWIGRRDCVRTHSKTACAGPFIPHTSRRGRQDTDLRTDGELFTTIC